MFHSQMNTHVSLAYRFAADVLQGNHKIQYVKSRLSLYLTSEGTQEKLHILHLASKFNKQTPHLYTRNNTRREWTSRKTPAANN